MSMIWLITLYAIVFWVLSMEFGQDLDFIWSSLFQFLLCHVCWSLYSDVTKKLPTKKRTILKWWVISFHIKYNHPITTYYYPFTLYIGLSQLKIWILDRVLMCNSSRNLKKKLCLSDSLTLAESFYYVKYGLSITTSNILSVMKT